MLFPCAVPLCCPPALSSPAHVPILVLVIQFPVPAHLISYVRLTLLKVLLRLTVSLAQSKRPPRGAKRMPIMINAGRTDLGVRIGRHAFSRCCLNAVSVVVCPTRPSWKFVLGLERPFSESVMHT